MLGISTNKKKKTSVENQATKANRVTDNAITCMLAKGTTIEGNISTSESVRIDGVLIGDIDCSLKLFLGENAIVRGNIKAAQILIDGQVTGDITASELVVLEQHARVIGNIQTAQLQILDGALFDGKCSI